MTQVESSALVQQKAAIAVTDFLASAKKALKLAAMLVLCLAIFGWSLPAQAASKISPRLQEQVLQIIREHPDVIIESVQGYQQAQQQKVQQAQQAFVEQLKAQPETIIAQSPTTGASESKIVLVEFSDFQCPYCAEAHKTLKQFMGKHEKEVKLVYKHFPLTAIHNQALPAAKAAWAAGQQGKFWEYQDALFTQQDKLGAELYITTAKNLNLDVEKFESDRNSEAANAAVQQDLQLAQVLGLSGTPFFIMNGEGLSGAVSLSDLENALSRVSKS